MKSNADRIGKRTPTATATADSIPISDASAKLDTWTTKYPTVQNVVTGSRTLGTAYPNTTGRPMSVSFTGYTDNAGSILTGYTDSSNPPTTGVVREDIHAAGRNMYINFWVMAGNYYKVDFDVGNKTKVYWVETY